MVRMNGGVMFLPSLMVINIFLFPLLTVRGKALLNPDGSHTMPEKNISVSQDQSVLTLTSCISLPNDTKFVTNIEVLGYTGNKTSGRLIYGPVASGTFQASPKAEMVRKFNLEKANVTLTSKLTKNLTTNQFEVKSTFRIGLTSSTLYYHSPVIRKIVVVVSSYGKENLQNEQLFSIFYPNSVGTAAPMTTVTPSTVGTAAPMPTVTSSTGPGNKSGAVIGGIIGAVAVFFAIGGIVMCCRYCCKKQGRPRDDKVPNPHIFNNFFGK